jgi:hypothetical protein
MRCIAVLSFLLLLAGCKSSGVKDLPAGLARDSIIPQTEMINLLVDVHILEAALQIKRNNIGDANPMELYYYNRLFSKYKLSRNRYKLNLEWYEQDPESFRKMYEVVEQKLDEAAKRSKSVK